MSALRLDDLLARITIGRETARLMNVKLPLHLLDRIDRVAERLNATKTDVVIALLNDGLAVAEKDLKGWTPPPKPVVPKASRCVTEGCDRARVAKGSTDFLIDTITVTTSIVIPVATRTAGTVAACGDMVPP